MATIEGNQVTTNKHYWEYLTKIEELCQLIFLKGYRGYKGTKKEKLKQLEKVVVDEYDAWAEAEAKMQEELDKVLGYDRCGNAYTAREAFDIYDFKDNKAGVKLTKKKPKRIPSDCNTSR